MKKSILKCFNLNKKTTGVLMVLFAFIFIVFYIFQVNYVSQKGFELRVLEDQKVALEKQNKQYQLQVINAQTMKNISAKAESLNLVATQEIVYLDLSGTTFVQR